VNTAWALNPSLAIHLTARFNSATLLGDVRALLVKYPEKAINEPEALHILLGTTLPTDVSSQLKVRLTIAKIEPY
jgi:phosphatidylinositol 4-kinase